MTETKSSPSAIEPARALSLASLVDYAPGAVVSRSLSQNRAGSLTVFAFDAGQGLSEHTAPFDAHVLLLDGQATITIGGRPVEVKAGEIVRMPANVSHALDGPGRFKMLLSMIRG